MRQCVRFACKEAALTEADEEAILIEAICSAFPLGQPPCPLFRKGAPRDDIYTDIEEAFGSKKWNELSISEWRGIGVHINVVRIYITEQALSYFIPGLILSGIEYDDLEFAVEGLLPTNQRWEPGGISWDTFIGTFNAEQRKSIRAFLAYVVHTEREGGSITAGAEHALWYKLYE